MEHLVYQEINSKHWNRYKNVVVYFMTFKILFWKMQIFPAFLLYLWLIFRLTICRSFFPQTKIIHEDMRLESRDDRNSAAYYAICDFFEKWVTPPSIFVGQ